MSFIVVIYLFIYLFCRFDVDTFLYLLLSFQFERGYSIQNLIISFVLLLVVSFALIQHSTVVKHVHIFTECHSFVRKMGASVIQL